MVDIKKISQEVASEMDKHLIELPPQGNTVISASAIKKAIVTISTDICCKILEKYDQQKS